MNRATNMPPACWSDLGDTNLVHKILETPLCDTHEHLLRRQSFRPERLDVLVSLFENYVTADLVVAGAESVAVANLTDPEAGTVADRFRPIAPAWQKCRYTGYGESVRLIAEHFYDLAELTPDSLEDAQTEHGKLMTTCTRQQILQQDALLDHVQIDDFTMAIRPDEEDQDFFLYDISLHNLVSGTPNLEELTRLTGIDVRSLNDLQTAMEAVFAVHAQEAVACKTQHAYDRTLAWRRRDRSDAAIVLKKYMASPTDMSTADKLLLGDWCLDICAALAHEHDLPIKIHTGYYAGHSRMPLHFVSCQHLCSLLAAHLDTEFVLMHNSYPYSEELVALAKHYPNVYIDMCWAWSINPYDAGRLLRHAIHAVPVNKVFVFGGDTSWPFAAYAYAMQARWWLTRTLQQEMQDGLLTETDAMNVADRVMCQNQFDCFRRLHDRA